MKTLTIETPLHSGACNTTDRARRPIAYLDEARTVEQLAHRRRCKSLPPLRADEAQHLMAAFVANKSVTICPPRYAAPSAQGSVDTTH
jgi:hypothetical protein